MRMIILIAVALVPDVASACSTCLDAAYGNRAFNWAFAALMLTPFAVAAGVLGAVVWVCHSARSASSGQLEPRGANPPGGRPTT